MSRHGAIRLPHSFSLPEIPPSFRRERLAAHDLAQFVISYNQFAERKNAAPGYREMPKLKLPNIEDVIAIDIHTHTEEPCGMHGDDGYDDFQAQMAEYFKSPNKHPPTVAETAAYYRSKKIAAVIFPVDAER